MRRLFFALALSLPATVYGSPLLTCDLCVGYSISSAMQIKSSVYPMPFPDVTETDHWIYGLEYAGPLGVYLQPPGFASFHPLVQAEIPAGSPWWIGLYQVYRQPNQARASQASVPDTAGSLVLLALGLLGVAVWRRATTR